MIKRQKNLNKFRVSWNISQDMWDFSNFWWNFFGRKKKKRWLIYQVWHISANPHLRIKFLLFFILVIFWIIISRLFYLQIIQWGYYSDLAFNQQYSRIELPARRWEIFASNSKTWEKQKLATNISLDLVYIDPNFINNKEKVAKELAEILFTAEDYKNCKEDIRTCPRWSTVKFDEKITLQKKPISWTWDFMWNDDVQNLKDTRSMEELKKDFADDILRKISKKYIDYLPLKYWASDKEIQQVKELWIFWLNVLEWSNIIYIDPTEIDQEKISDYAKRIVKIFPDKKRSQIELFLTKRRVQYVPLKRKISPELSEKIRNLKEKSYQEFLENKKNNFKNSNEVKFYWYKWVVLIKEHWRYYPEKNLASQVLWFVDNEWVWRYWIEEYFNELLSWKNWIIFNKKNARWEFIFLDNKKFSEVKDGESVVLTIDKIIQRELEKYLKEWTEQFWADKWQAIIINPQNWEILAMANYPDFNPNDFWKVYEIWPIKEWWVPDWKARDLKPKNPEKEWQKMYYTQPVFIKDEEWKYKRFYFDDAEAENMNIREAYANSWIVLDRIQKYMYKNWTWLDSYINHNVMSTYEPWSVFKPLVTAMALDANEVTPMTTYEEFWPIEIDTWTSQKQFIRTAEWIYRWIQTVTNAIEHSSNIWMAFIARKLWAQLFYYYLKKFNFWEKYWIEQNWEKEWKLKFWKKWNEAKLLTTSFWQWISVTPLQMVVSWSALVNWWNLIKPTLLKRIIDINWKTIYEHQPKIIKRVISEKASAQSIAILVSSVENWVAKPWWVPWYKIWWKTWTAQMACSDKHRCQIWTYEPKKEWNFITSYAWFWPAENPKFLTLIKYDRPRVWVKTYWSNTAAITHRKITKFLLDYYGIKKSNLDK